MKNFGMCFSKDFSEHDPLSHIGRKLPSYLYFLNLCRKEGWNTYCVTRRTYKAAGVFEGAWLFNGTSKFEKINSALKMDLVFDWTSGLEFPPKNDPGLNVMDSREFKILCADKWQMYQKLKKYMRNTFFVDRDKKSLRDILQKIEGDWVVLKPLSGLKGKGIYVGDKKSAFGFDFEDQDYIAQEFVDTSRGIPGIVGGRHDLRIVINNRKVVWCHIRIPREGTYKANVGQGGKLIEVDYKKVPESVRSIVEEISGKFYIEYDNPLFSIDFGIDGEGYPWVFEINDQIGFPMPNVIGKEIFLKELVENFKTRI